MELWKPVEIVLKVRETRKSLNIMGRIQKKGEVGDTGCGGDTAKARSREGRRRCGPVTGREIGQNKR